MAPNIANATIEEDPALPTGETTFPAEQQESLSLDMETQDAISEIKDDPNKVALLDNLLEKAGLYSSFLFSNMSTAATIQSTEDETSENIDKGKKRKRSSTRKAQGVKKLKQVQDDSQYNVITQFQQPTLLTGGTLRQYQLDGIRWLCNLFENGLNGILADEMGLGKTIQVIGLIAHLKALGVRGPYLIVAPLSTLPNWEKEFRKWTPTIPCHIYHGNIKERLHLLKTTLSATNQHDTDFPVIITNYETMNTDGKKFIARGFKWKYIIIDEGHRLKNMNCQLVKQLKALSSENRLLLTGTPLQNNLTELWALLNFILPDVFDDLDLFESWFSFEHDESETTLTELEIAKQNKIVKQSKNNRKSKEENIISGIKRAEIVTKLHDILRPFLLRRLKTDVIAEMPSKVELFVYCAMTPIQRSYYQMIVNGTLKEAMQRKYGRSQAAIMFGNMQLLRNRAMQLRKCCNHPYLFDEPDTITDERLVEASGKLIVLDKMLFQHLLPNNHKVLIFSQMTRVLDILEDFLSYRQVSYCRLDGSTDLHKRQEQMDEFNAGKSNSPPVFLLSTRAGGLGINLIAADTVIFFDSDWNPQADNQAQDRCHRIGQTKEILVYRLVTENSFENRMIKRAIEKRKLERVVIQRGEFKQDMSASKVSADGDKENDFAAQTLGGTRTPVTNDELKDLMRDDVLIRDGIESGGICDDELANICDREIVVQNFVKKRVTKVSNPRTQKAISLSKKGHGYEVVDNSYIGMASLS